MSLQSSKKKSGATETVLLRHPRPKYDFQGRKLDKKPTVSKSSIITSRSEPSLTSKVVVTKPSVQSVVRSEPSPVQSQTVNPTLNMVTQTPVLNQQTNVYTRPVTTQHYAQHDTKTKSAGIVRPLSSASASGQSMIFPTPATNIQLPQKPIQMIAPVQSSMSTGLESSGSHCVLPIPDPSAAILKLEQERVPSREEMNKLKQENDQLKQDLDVQLKVNGELKKLLIASVGDDLERRVERLARDKAELSEEVGGFSKKVTEDYENFDKVSIQADMWRSKFLASRVMVDELASARAFYSLQYQESQDALQQLLTERHELRANLLETFKTLQQVKGAFDPLNTHRSVSLPSTNVMDLARMSQRLAEAIRYRLLPGQLTHPTVIDMDCQLEKTLTQAETFAQEVVARQTKLDPAQKSVSGNLFGPGDSQIERYHPDARFDNLTMNCCGQCKGDINVL